MKTENRTPIISASCERRKKPAIASEWRENKEAQERAQREVDREAARAARARLLSAVSALIKGLVLKVGWVVALTAGVLAAAALLTLQSGRSRVFSDRHQTSREPLRPGGRVVC